MKRIFIIVAIGMLFANVSQAAVLKFVSLGNDQVKLFMDTQTESVNALEAHITFDPKEFSVTDTSDGASIISLWLTRPAISNDNGTIDLAGVIPGGTNTPRGTIITFTIDPKQNGLSKGFTVASGRVLLNDGNGTPAKLSFSSSSFAMTTAPLPTSTAVVNSEAPDPFTPAIAHDPNLFNGQYFLVFSTTDLNSGIDHYEVLEVPQGTIGAIASWQQASSPYLLQDQTLSSDIYVRAMNKAHNFRVVKLPATTPPISTSTREPYLLGLAILLGIGILWLAWRKKAR